MNSHICVGGPKAGQRVQTKSHYFKVALPLHPTIVNSHGPDEPTSVSVIEYRRQTFYTEETEGEHLTVWAPSTQSAKQTLELLLETYEIYRTQTRR